MARLDEGDPRWIVEEREDTTNINNWHWTERNGTEWSKCELKELFAEMNLMMGEIPVTVEVKTIEGEASANNRKARIILMYEWDIQLVVKVDLVGGGEFKAEIQIPDLSDEHSSGEVSVMISMKTNGDGADTFDDFLRKSGVPVVRKCFEEYESRFSKWAERNLIKQSKSQLKKKSEVSSSGCSTISQVDKPKSSIQRKDEANVTFELEEEFRCSREHLFHILTTEDKVRFFTRSNATVKAFVDGEFSLFDGSVTGSFVEIEIPSRIVQRFRLKDWEKGCYAKVTLSLTEIGSGTIFKIKCTEVPRSSETAVKKLFKQTYFNNLSGAFGFGGLPRTF